MDNEEIEMPTVVPQTDDMRVRHHLAAEQKSARRNSANAAAVAAGGKASDAAAIRVDTNIALAGSDEFNPRGRLTGVRRRNGAPAAPQEDDEYAADAREGLAAGNPLEFWVTAAVAVGFSVVVLGAARFVQRRAVRYGALLGSGLSFTLLGFGIFVYILADTGAHFAVALIPLIGCVLGPLMMHRAVLLWAESEKREGRRHLDIMFVFVILLGAITVVVAASLGYFAQALVASM